MIKDRIPDQFHRIYWIVTRGGAVFLAVPLFFIFIGECATWISVQNNPAFFDLLTGLCSEDLNRRIRVTSIFVSTLLTFALIAVYRDIGATQQDQVSVLQNQSELMDVQHEPVVEIREMTGQNDRIKIQLANVGNGPATDLGVVFHVQPRDSDSNVIELPENEFAHPLTREHSTGESSIQADDEEAYMSEIYIPTRDDNGLSGLFSQETEQLSRGEAESIVFQVEVTFDHLMNTKGKGHVHSNIYSTEIDGRTSIEEVMNNRSKVIPTENLVSEDSQFETPNSYFDPLG